MDTLIVLLTTSPSLANAGTPLMWAGLFHLTFGNALIGTIEATVAAPVLRVKRRGLLLLLVVLANYASALAGYWLLGRVAQHYSETILGDVPILGVRRYVTLMLAAAFVLSLAIEWPLYFAAMRNEPRAVSRSFAALALGNVVSYGLLVAYYAYFSHNTLGGYELRGAVDPTAGVDGVTVFFIGADDGDVYTARLDGAPSRRVFALGERSDIAFLYTSATESPDVWTLSRILDTHDHDEVTLGPVRGTRPEAGPPMPSYRGAADDFRGSGESTYDYSTGLWAAQGLMRYKRDARVDEPLEGQIAVELPMLDWPARKPTVLPGDRVVFQLGDQILLADMPKRVIYFLALGRGPTVLNEVPPAKLPTATTPE